MKTKWGHITVVAIILIAIYGFTNHTGEEKSFIPSKRDQPSTDIYANNNFTTSNLENTSEDYFTNTIIEDEPSINDVSQLDYLVRTDLGFPRIERILNTYEETIKRYSNRYGFDWQLILAVMNQESRFRVQAVSHRGAYGLMQIMPTTGRDVSTALGIESVNHPEDNIAGGVYYLWRVRSMFNAPDDSRGGYTRSAEDDLIRLSLAAYNAGPTRVRDAQQLAEYLGLNPYHWDVIRDLLPMLSQRYYTLHHYVWENGRPAGGYFYGWPETINYVESVMGYYSYYKMIFD